MVDVRIPEREPGYRCAYNRSIWRANFSLVHSASQRPLDVAFSTLPRLRSLSIASTAATLCPTFFASLHAHNAALERLELHGPRAEGGDAAATCALVSERLEALVYEAEYGNGAATKLRELVLDVTLPRLTADTALAVRVPLSLFS